GSSPPARPRAPARWGPPPRPRPPIPRRSTPALPRAEALPVIGKTRLLPPIALASALAAAAIGAVPDPARPGRSAPPRWVAQEIDPRIGNVCYALTAADVNSDGRPDVVAISEDAVVWYENPTWTKKDIVRGVTERDNVCIQPHDVDGDGRIDLILGA